MTAAKAKKCKCCGGELAPNGEVGRLAWFRCRSCGAEQSRARETDDDDLTELPCWYGDPTGD